MALDERGTLGRSLEVRSTPTTVVFDGAGREVARRSGAVNAEWLTRRVLPLVR
ncbi:MAG: TlpA family protein disulfide reductase [Spirochaetota bacterium]